MIENNYVDSIYIPNKMDEKPIYFKIFAKGDTTFSETKYELNNCNNPIYSLCEIIIDEYCKMVDKLYNFHLDDILTRQNILDLLLNDNMYNKFIQTNELFNTHEALRKHIYLILNVIYLEVKFKNVNLSHIHKNNIVGFEKYKPLIEFLCPSSKWFMSEKKVRLFTDDSDLYVNSKNINNLLLDNSNKLYQSVDNLITKLIFTRNNNRLYSMGSTWIMILTMIGSIGLVQDVFFNIPHYDSNMEYYTKEQLIKKHFISWAWLDSIDRNDGKNISEEEKHEKEKELLDFIIDNKINYLMYDNIFKDTERNIVNAINNFNYKLLLK